MKFIGLLFLIILLPFTVFSQQKGVPKSYTLQECIDIALKNNTDILLSSARVEASTADITSAFGDYLPSLRLNGGYTRQLNPDGGKTVNIGGQTLTIGKSEPNSYNMNIAASYTLFDGFNREYNYSRAKNSYDAYLLDMKFTRQKITVSIYRAFVDVTRNLQILKIRRENLELGKKDLERIQARYDAGLIPVTSVYSQEAELGNRELEVVRAQNDYNISKSNLLIMMGYNPDINADFLESSLPDTLTASGISQFRKDIGSIDEMVKSALGERLDYKSHTLGINAAKAAINSAMSGYFPNLSAQGGWSWSNSVLEQFGELGRSYIGLNLSVPVFENFKTNYQIENSRLQLTQQQLQQYQVEQQIRSAVKTSFINLEAAEKQYEITERTIKSSFRNFESVNERFKVGSLGIADYYLANNLLVTAQINRITAVYNYFQAQKEVLFAIGKIE